MPSSLLSADEEFLMETLLPTWVYEAYDGLGGPGEAVEIWRHRFLEAAELLLKEYERQKAEQAIPMMEPDKRRPPP